ncbi:MAG: hypothetical protein SO314_07035 [Alphaproteobacteria bacterium]|nr:hypothetical protein [Alphaproteobacteria bacterium]
MLLPDLFIFLVIAGLDPAIHLSTGTVPVSSWILGSQPENDSRRKPQNDSVLKPSCTASSLSSGKIGAVQEGIRGREI